jgi:cell division protein FtsI (penicillin-binding protein 3)
MKAGPLDGDDNPCRPRHFLPVAATSTALVPQAKSLALSRNRLAVTGAVFVFAFLVIGTRLAQVTLLIKPDAELTHLVQPAVVKPVDYGRADIIDRNGAVLATTLDSPSLFAYPHQIADPADTAHKLARVLPGTDEAKLRARLTATDKKSFVSLYHHLTPSQQYAVNALGVPGLEFEPEQRRIYPNGALAAHVVGYLGVANNFSAGMERSFDADLESTREPLQLSIDIRLQDILREEMEKTVADFSAVGATGIIMDVRSGEILSMVSLPDFDPNDRDNAVKETMFNRATLGVYEMGSVFKIFNTALALDSHKSTLNSIYDTRPITIGRFTIHDYHPFNRPASVTEIFMESSNIGSARMVMENGPEVQKAFLDKLGLLRPPAIELPEIGVPEVPHPWREINAMTIAFGHGLAVSPLQTAIAASAIVNGGILRPATLIKHAEGYVPDGTRVVSERTSEEMRKLMRLVVTEGTGKKADVPGYLVGGKTGTADKVSAHGGYAKKALLSSFIGVFPMNDPQYMVYVIIDEPHGTKKSYGFATAGWTAAPAVSRIVARMAPLYGVRPIEETPEIHRAITLDLSGPSRQVAEVD